MKDLTKLYDRLNRYGLKCAACNNDEEALTYFSWAAELAWKNAATCFNNKTINNKLYALGAKRRLIPRRVPHVNKIRIGYICSGISDFGGLWQVVENFLRYQDRNRFEIYIYSTEVYRDSHEIGKQRWQTYLDFAKKIFVPNFTSSYSFKAEELKTEIMRDKIDIGFFFLLPNDVIAHYILPQLGLPLSVFFHASAHVYCLGCDLYDFHIDFNQIRHERCKREVNHPRTILMNQPGRISLSELSSDNRQIVTKEELGFRQDSILTVTCGGAHKIFWANTNEYIAVIRKMLEKYDKVSHLLIGPGMKNVGNLILKDEAAFSRRLKVLNYVENPISIYCDADIFLDTYPLGGALASFDAMAAGLPVVGEPALEYLLKDERTIARSYPEYFNIVSRLIEDEQLRLEIGENLRSVYRENYDPTIVVPEYEKLFVENMYRKSDFPSSGRSINDGQEPNMCVYLRQGMAGRDFLEKFIGDLVSDRSLSALDRLCHLPVAWNYADKKGEVIRKFARGVMNC